MPPATVHRDPPPTLPVECHVCHQEMPSTEEIVPCDGCGTEVPDHHIHVVQTARQTHLDPAQNANLCDRCFIPDEEPNDVNLPAYDREPECGDGDLE